MVGFALPYDANGTVSPHDHPDLQGDARILRGVAEYHIVNDANRGCRRLSSALFKNDPNRQGYLSIGSQPCIEGCGENPADYMLERGWLGVVSMTVDKFRTYDPNPPDAAQWQIGLYPLLKEDPPDPCHGAVWGKINESRANQIRRAVDWLVQIPDVVLDEVAFNPG